MNPLMDELRALEARIAQEARELEWSLNTVRGKLLGVREAIKVADTYAPALVVPLAPVPEDLSRVTYDVNTSGLDRAPGEPAVYGGPCSNPNWPGGPEPHASRTFEWPRPGGPGFDRDPPPG